MLHGIHLYYAHKMLKSGLCCTIMAVKTAGGIAQMSSFSSVACYSALSSCSKDNILTAYARMVAFLVQQKKYVQCDAEELANDFEIMFGFKIPYHPMRTIMNQCAQLGYFTYNPTLYTFFPNYECINDDNFLGIIQEKNNEYNKLLDHFNAFLIEQHNIYSSKEDLDDRIRAFIERYGIKAKADRDILRKVKDDYFFAEYLVSCEENGQTEVLDYLDEYTIGVALSEVFIYSEYPENFTAKNARAYLDTGLLFKLFGVDSANHTASYTQYVKNMQRIGIRVMVYEHTVNEMIGIIESSKHWIGNPDYDATLSSESTFFFVSNNWSVEEIDELSLSIRNRLVDEFNITIDRMPYPKAEDIHTPYEAAIREMIVDLYKENDPNLDVDAISYTIDQDAKSIFFTQHKNGNKVAYHIDDIENVFITTNRSLAKVGYKISYNIAQSKEVFIPVVMNDIKWGTLIWFNSPTLISSINRPRLVSAAYAAFRPNPELTRKLNERLIALEAEGKVTPEQCYLLKVNPLAQHLLARKTMNDPDRFVDITPLEILKELGRESFEQGSASRQAEIDQLKEQREVYELQLAIEKQNKLISEYEQKDKMLSAKIQPAKDRVKVVKKELSELQIVKKEIDDVVIKNIGIFKCATIISAIAFIIIAIWIGIENSPLFSVLTFIAPIIMWAISKSFGKEITYAMLAQKVEDRTREKQNCLRRYSDAQLISLENEKNDLLTKIEDLENQQTKNAVLLKKEKEKMDNFSIDTSILEKIAL